MVELREYERKTLVALNKLGGKASAQQLIQATGLPDAAVARAVLTLKEKQMVQTSERKQTLAKLTEEGVSYARSGLPERRMMVALEKLGGKASLDEVISKAGLEKQFVPIALGWVQRKKWALLDSKTKSLQLQKVEEGKDEELLKFLGKQDQTVVVDELDREFQDAVQILKGRKLLDVEEKTHRIIELTNVGQTIIKKGLKATVEVTQLTPELIISGKWRKAKLQAYNIQAPVAKTWPGKKHPYLQFLDEVKQKLVALGFEEMVGPAVETAFFNFDALYTPQGHPARESSGIYYIKSPTMGNIDKYATTMQKVKKTHEDGWKTGSTGWKYSFSTRAARRLILRGHGTSLSARTLLSSDLKIPGKYFAIARCYRPEVVDKTHLTEFNQVEGIVADENLTLRDLLGVLKKFAVEMAGADRIKFRPDYFPFTEPSVELAAYKKGYGWVEFGGSGIFRPEVTEPLGIKVPVIAWGLGVDRLFMMRAGIDQISQIFTQDLDWLRRKAVV
jgi:phenylalanyl-tRNA synthetase alpha chain